MDRVIVALLFLLWHVPTALAGQTGLTLAVEPTPVLTIGEALGNSPAYSFTGIASISVVGDSIFVLEGTANEIRIFAHDGKFLGRIGREGEGPGEFMWPTAMRLVADEIAVIDLRLRRQSFFSLAGDLIRTEPLGRLGDQALAGSARMQGGAVVAETAVTISSEGGAFPERLLVLVDPETQRVDTIARYSTGYVPYQAPGSYGFLEARAGSEGDWAVAGDSLLAVVSGEPPELRWWRSGDQGLRLAGELVLPVGPESFTRDDARELIDKTNEGRRAAGTDLLPRSVQVDAPRYWGQVKQLVISDQEECWIQWDRPRSDEDDEWFRVNLESRVLERAVLPPGYRMLAAAGENLYGFVLTDYDVPEITVLRLRQTRSR